MVDKFAVDACARGGRKGERKENERWTKGGRKVDETWTKGGQQKNEKVNEMSTPNLF